MNAENAKLQYEGGQTAYPMGLLTDSGDHTTFDSSADLWSKATGYTPNVKPNGLATGGAVSVADSGSNDVVDVAALTCYLAGVLTSVAADTDVAVTRGASSNTHAITSITVNSSGVIAAVAGTASTAFSETRAAAGGPPLIPVGSIEIAQVRTTSVTAAAITAAEIFQTIGSHQERYDYPVWTEHPETGTIEFASALPLIHTGPTARRVYASYAAPIFTDVPKAVDFVPPEKTYSVSSTPIYGAVLGSTSSTLNQGSFTAYLNDGVGDPLVSKKGEILWFKFFPDRYKSSYLLCQGKLGVSRTFPAGNEIQAACTISSESEGTEVPL